VSPPEGGSHRRGEGADTQQVTGREGKGKNSNEYQLKDAAKKAGKRWNWPATTFQGNPGEAEDSASKLNGTDVAAFLGTREGALYRRGERTATFLRREIGK